MKDTTIVALELELGDAEKEIERLQNQVEMLLDTIHDLYVWASSWDETLGEAEEGEEILVPASHITTVLSKVLNQPAFK